MPDPHVISTAHDLGALATIGIILECWLMIGWLIGIVWGAICKDRE